MRVVLDNGEGWEFDISDSAAEAVRLSFNPSGSDDVEQIKTMAAALITLCEKQRARGHAVVARAAATAITNVEQGAMWAIKAATFKA